MTETDTYLDEPPEDVDKSQEEWEELSYDTQYHYANEDRRERKREREKERLEEKKEWVREQKSNAGCFNCSETRSVCLDMHHVGEKEGNVGEMAQSDRSWGDLEAEVEKCVVVCANCHRLIHSGSLEVPEEVK